MRPSTAGARRAAISSGRDRSAKDRFQNAVPAKPSGCTASTWTAVRPVAAATVPSYRTTKVPTWSIAGVGATGDSVTSARAAPICTPTLASSVAAELAVRVAV